MSVGIVLLSNDNYYLGKVGELPSPRPEWDKKLLLNLCKDKICICSQNTYESLPKSLFDISKGIYVAGNGNINYDVNLGINTFKTQKPEVLYIVRTGEDLGGGKEFRMSDILENYVKCDSVYNKHNIEIYVKKLPLEELC
jgi:hypothetical protein